MVKGWIAMYPKGTSGCSSFVKAKAVRAAFDGELAGQFLIDKPY